MDRKNRGHAFVPFLVGLILGGVLGWLLLVPPGKLLVDDVTDKSQLTDVQISNLSEVLDLGGKSTRSLRVDVGSDANPCCWPETCWPRPAHDLLTEIGQWADGAPITEELKQDLREEIGRCLDPGLVNKSGVHVCKIKDPEPCSDLADRIWSLAETAHDIEDPQEAEAAWRIVKDELDQFPGDRL